MVTQCVTEACAMTPGGSTVGHVISASSPQPTQIDSVSSNTGCSTTVTSSSSPAPQAGNNGGHVSPQPSSKRPGENRRSNKPIMEKRRRARINNCLNELKSLILDAMKKDPARHSKLEKADILEMTVKHLETMQRQQTAMTVATDPQVLNKFRAGFSECAGEVGRFPGLEPPVRRRLLQHLTNVLNTSTGNEGTTNGVPSLQANSQGTTSGPSIPGLQVHILPAVQADSTNSGAPLLTQQSILFSTSTNGASLQLVPTRLPNGDIALVLPSSPSNPSQVNINLSNGGVGGTNSAKIVNNGSSSSGTALGTVIVPGTVTAVSPVAPSALSPLPMLIPISSRSSSQQSSGTATPMVSPTSNSVPTSVSTISSSQSSSTIPSATPTINSPLQTINVTSIPSSSPFQNKQTFVISTVSSPQTNNMNVPTIKNQISPITSTVSPTPSTNIPSSSSSFGSNHLQRSSPTVDISMNSRSFPGDTSSSNDSATRNLSNDECIVVDTQVSDNVAPKLTSFMKESATDSPRNPSNKGSFVGENLTFSNFVPRNSQIGINSAVETHAPRIGTIFTEETLISSNSVQRTHSPSSERVFREENITIPNDFASGNPIGINFAGEKLSRTSSPLSLISVTSPSSSLSSPISPELRNIQQPSRQLRDVVFHDNYQNNRQSLGSSSGLLTVPSGIFRNNFEDAQGIDLRIESNRSYVSPPMTGPLSLVMKKTDEADMEDDAPWRPW